MSPNNSEENKHSTDAHNVTNAPDHCQPVSNLQDVIASNVSRFVGGANQNGGAVTQCLRFARPIVNFYFVLYGIIFIIVIIALIFIIIQFVKTGNIIDKAWSTPRGNLRESPVLNQFEMN